MLEGDTLDIISSFQNDPRSSYHSLHRDADHVCPAYLEGRQRVHGLCS